MNQMKQDNKRKYTSIGNTGIDLIVEELRVMEATKLVVEK